MDYSIFAHSIARIKAMENKLLGRAKLDSMIDAKDFEDAIKLLQDTLYGDYISSSSYENGLKSALEELYRLMYEIIPEARVIDVLALRYDGHNIKSILKGRLSGIDTSGILINAGTISANKMKEAIISKEYKDVPEPLVKITVEAEAIYNRSEDPQDIDIVVDKGIFKYALELARKSGYEYLSEYLKLQIDISNIKTFIRVKAQERSIEFLDKVFIEGGNLEYQRFAGYINEGIERFTDKLSYSKFSKWSDHGIAEYIRNGDLGGLDRFGDNYLLEHIKRAKFISLGTEPIIAYVIARENEIRAIRIILTGKKSNVHPDKIRERMRDVYV